VTAYHWRVPRPRPSTATLRSLALASLIANITIVVTGGAVRLTASGLGCPTWPECTEDSWVPAAEHGIHGAIEFGNRLFTFVVGVVAVAMLVAAYRSSRRDLRRLALAIFLGVGAQAVLGGITVRTQLNPWTVGVHFLLSMVLIGVATVLVRRTREGDQPPRLLVHPLLHRLALGMLAVVAAVLYLGTVVTGSGPHSGDPAAARTGLDPETVSQLHADAVFLLIGLSVALAVALAATRAPRSVRSAAYVLIGVELAQGTVGYVQYFTGLPIALVGLHLLGAGLLVVAAVQVVLAMRDRGPLTAGVAAEALRQPEATPAA